MKKTLSIVIMTVVLVSSSWAQEPKSNLSINTRAWSTNYWTTLLYDVAAGVVTHFFFNGSDAADAIIPGGDLVFPVGISKVGFADPSDIYGPYHRAFATPFARLGDFGVGLDLSWTPSVVGIYAGAYYKSQELCFKADDRNLRANYFMPRAGIILGKPRASIEAGVYYDMVVGCGGNWQAWGKPDKAMFLSGLGLDFALSTGISPNSKTILMFSLPLHNFLNPDYAGGLLSGLERKVGYITLTHRILL